jgi:hypothetical protein
MRAAKTPRVNAMLFRRARLDLVPMSSERDFTAGRCRLCLPNRPERAHCRDCGGQEYANGGPQIAIGPKKMRALARPRSFGRCCKAE